MTDNAAPDPIADLFAALGTFAQEVGRELQARAAEAYAIVKPLADQVAAHPELLAASRPAAAPGCYHACWGSCAHECAGEATTTLAYRPGGPKIQVCQPCADTHLVTA